MNTQVSILCILPYSYISFTNLTKENTTIYFFSPISDINNNFHKITFLLLNFDVERFGNKITMLLIVRFPLVNFDV